MVTDFYQEIHRTKLRQYSCNDKIVTHVFAVKNIILRMIEQLFPSKEGRVINLIDDELVEFKESKIEGRVNKNGTRTVPQKFLEWYNTWDGEKINISIIKENCVFTNEDWKGVKKNKTIKEIFNEINTIREGKNYYLTKTILK